MPFSMPARVLEGPPDAVREVDQKLACTRPILTQKRSRPAPDLAFRVERLSFNQLDQVRHLFRAVAEGIGPGGLLNIVVLNLRVRMIKTNGAFEPKLFGTV